MKRYMFSATLALGSFGLLVVFVLPARAQVARDSDSAAAVERNDESPAARGANKGTKGAAALPVKAETDDRAVQDADGNDVRKITKD